jgi:hypothetical protein
MNGADECDRLKQKLEPFFGSFLRGIREGFADYYREHGEESFKHTARSRASLVNDLIVDRIQRALAEDHPEIAAPIRKLSGRRLFEITDDALLHVKKINHKLVASNYPTFFALCFNEVQFELPGFGPLPRLTLGFIPSKDWSRIEGVHITRPNGDTVEWSIPISEETLNVTELVLQNDGQSEPKRRARPKRGAGGKQASGQS